MRNDQLKIRWIAESKMRAEIEILLVAIVRVCFPAVRITPVSFPTHLSCYIFILIHEKNHLCWAGSST
jgi:hypothetical protein